MFDIGVLLILKVANNHLGEHGKVTNPDDDDLSHGDDGPSEPKLHSICMYVLANDRGAIEALGVS